MMGTVVAVVGSGLHRGVVVLRDVAERLVLVVGAGGCHGHRRCSALCKVLAVVVVVGCRLYKGVVVGSTELDGAARAGFG